MAGCCFDPILAMARSLALLVPARRGARQPCRRARKVRECAHAARGSKAPGSGGGLAPDDRAARRDRSAGRDRRCGATTPRGASPIQFAWDVAAGRLGAVAVSAPGAPGRFGCGARRGGRHRRGEEGGASPSRRTSAWSGRRSAEGSSASAAVGSRSRYSSGLLRGRACGRRRCCSASTCTHVPARAVRPARSCRHQQGLGFGDTLRAAGRTLSHSEVALPSRRLHHSRQRGAPRRPPRFFSRRRGRRRAKQEPERAAPRVVPHAARALLRRHFSTTYPSSRWARKSSTSCCRTPWRYSTWLSQA